MSHCYSVGVEMGGQERDICTIVPGNEELSKHVHEAEEKKTKPRAPTKEEIDRAIDYHLKQHSDKDHPLGEIAEEEVLEETDPEIDDMMKLKE